MDTAETACCVHGYDVYGQLRSVRSLYVKGRGVCNLRDRYAVAVVKDRVTVGYNPKKISSLCCLFIHADRWISCRYIISLLFSSHRYTWKILTHSNYSLVIIFRGSKFRTLEPTVEIREN